MTQEKHSLYFLDDDPKLLALVRAKLSEEFELTLFEEAMECLDKAQVKRPDLIIVDLNMPNIDGFEFLTQLNAHPMTSSIPIVCTSASNRQSDRSRAEKLGAVGFLSKPYNLKTLKQDIRFIIENLNKTIASEGSRTKAVVCFNRYEKRRLLKSETSRLLKDGEKVLVLGWERGEDFIDAGLHEALKSERLFYLEMGPEIMAKLPYMQDVYPIFEEMQAMAPGLNLKEARLIMDNPEGLFNLENKDRSTALAMTLSKMFETSFKNADIFLMRQSEPDRKAFSMRLTNIFVGGAN